MCSIGNCLGLPHLKKFQTFEQLSEYLWIEIEYASEFERAQRVKNERVCEMSEQDEWCCEMG